VDKFGWSAVQDFQSENLSRHVGVEISGLDMLAALRAETITALRKLWVERGLLVFRGVEFSIEEQIAFAEQFGTPQETGTTSAHQPDRRILLISNIRENGEAIGALPDGELQFHADSVFLKTPIKGAMLYALEVPDTGGDTVFTNAATAYEGLPAALKTRLEGLEALNAYDYSTQVRTGRYDKDGGPEAVHPVILRHPETARKSIFVNRLMTEEIIGLSPDDSDVLLQTLWEEIERPEYRYTHKWRAGDVLLWDNRFIQHARTDFPADQRRLLRRVALAG